MAASPSPASIVPAQLGFLAIFNPALGATDDTIDDQIVYYTSVSAQNSPGRRHRTRGKPIDHISHEERNERLRQIGLAQGMVEFGRGFADDQSVDTIDTERSRVVLHELEPGWWILASIDLTKLPLPPRLGSVTSNSKDEAPENVEYSSREVKPAALLQQDLLRAHSVFLLHHAASLSALFVKSKRSKFMAILSRYWDLFLSTWDVLLHGNPACAVFGGIKIAASGELGMGVGEEERGSGEREVLEGFVGRIEGLVDLIVSKFGDSEPEKTVHGVQDKQSNEASSSQWLGTGEEPGAEDGGVFLGVGALSRKSIRDITWWMEDLYTWGEDAYGVKESPTSTRAKARRDKAKSGTMPQTIQKQDSQRSTQSQGLSPTDRGSPASDKASPGEEGGVNKFMSYLKMGYGTHWSLGSSPGGAGEATHNAASNSANTGRPEGSDLQQISRHSSIRAVSDGAGHFLIGLQGDVEETGSEEGSESSESESRTLLRTVTVELESEAHGRPEATVVRDLGSQLNELAISGSGRKDSADPTSHFDSQDRNKTKKMRVVVYVSRPFIYTFLFENRTDSLAWDSLYRSLHYQLAPLRRPLAVSTSYRPERPFADGGNVNSGRQIFDLVWDPHALTINSTIPNIPEPMYLIRQEGQQQFLQQQAWSRVEALNTHMQILNTYVATRMDGSELERTSKTSRGWWIVWTRMLEPGEGVGVFASSAATGSTGSAGEVETEMGSETPQMPSEPSRGSITGETTAADEPSAATSEPRTPHHRIAKRRREDRKPKVSREIFLVRRAGDYGSAGHLRALSTSSADAELGGDGAGRLTQGIGVDTRKYIEALLNLAR